MIAGLENMSATELVKDVSRLVTLPEVSIKVTQMVDDENSTAADIGKIISQDAGLSARLLKIANSPFYGLSSKVDTVSRAVTILGLREIRDLVLSSTATRAFEGIPTDLISVEDFWHHSLYCGLLSQSLGEVCKKTRSESLFVAGLLHDIGQLIMFNKLPEQMQAALMRTMQGEPTLEMYEAEREVIGFDHAQVGLILAQEWRLPNNLQECIAYHHEPEKAELFPVHVAIVHIANEIASLPFIEESDLSELDSIKPMAREVTGLNDDDLKLAVEMAREHLAEAESIYFS